MVEITKNTVMPPTAPNLTINESVKSLKSGWNTFDTSAPAAAIDDITQIRKVSATNGVILTGDPVDSEEVISLLDKAYEKVSAENHEAVEAVTAEVISGPDMLKRHMDALSRKIDEALRAEVCDYEKVHAMMLRFCMIHLRHVVKDDHEYIAKIGDRIKIQSGKIRDSYNTWPIVSITLVSSAISIVGGVAGFSPIIRPGSEMARAFAQNAQQISTMSTGISGVGSLLSSSKEGDRQVMHLYLKRDQDKEEEKKSLKHGTKDSQKGFRAAIEEFFRNMRETISSILRG